MDGFNRYKLLKIKEATKGREARKERLQNDRQNQRRQILEVNRNIEESPKPAHKQEIVKKKSRLELLKEWKLQKNQKENELKLLKKPPFHAGKLLRKATGSPLLTAHPNVPAAGQNGMMTRSRAKQGQQHTVKTAKPSVLRQLNQVKNNSLRPVKSHIFAVPKAVAVLRGLTLPQSPKITKSARKSTKPKLEEPDAMEFSMPAQEMDSGFARQSRNLSAMMDRIERESLPIANQETLPNVEVRPVLEAVSKPIVMEYSPCSIQRPVSEFEHLTFSPFVQNQRGSARKQRISSLKPLSLDEKVDVEIQKEETEKNSRIASFRIFLTNETKRLLGLSETWRAYREQDSSMPADVEGDIDAVVGMTKLLTSDKFKQFSDLIAKCESGDPMIKVDDLQGFHDWVSLEVEDLDKAFFHLQERKKSNWAEKIVDPLPVVKKTLKLTKVIAKKPTGASSNMRALILAARKKNQNKELSTEPNMTSNVECPSQPSPQHEGCPKPSLPSPRHEACLTPSRTGAANLRVRVLQRCSGLEMLSATSLARSSLSPKTPPPCAASPSGSDTMKSPARSILKRTPAPYARKNVGFAGLDPKFLLPNPGTPSDGSPEILNLVSTPTPRRSTRLANKTPA